MGKGFITSARENSYPCSKCGKKPTVGQDLFMQNLGTEEAKNWIACTDQVCFESQGGDKGVIKSKGKYSRTVEQRTEDVKVMINATWPVCFQYAVTFLKERAADSNFKDTMIFAEVLYKGGAIAWARQ